MDGWIDGFILGKEMIHEPILKHFNHGTLKERHILVLQTTCHALSASSTIHWGVHSGSWEPLNVNEVETCGRHARYARVWQNKNKFSMENFNQPIVITKGGLGYRRGLEWCGDPIVMIHDDPPKGGMQWWTIAPTNRRCFEPKRLVFEPSKNI